MLSGIAPPTFPTLEHGLYCAGHSCSEDLRSQRRRAWVVAEGGGSGLGWIIVSNLVRAGTLANAAVCNISITSESLGRNYMKGR